MSTSFLNGPFHTHRYFAAIALPSQSIAVEKDTEVPSTKRRLTFDALILHLKHHNVTTRRGERRMIYILTRSFNLAQMPFSDFENSLKPTRS